MRQRPAPVAFVVINNHIIFCNHRCTVHIDMLETRVMLALSQMPAVTQLLETHRFTSRPSRLHLPRCPVLARIPHLILCAARFNIRHSDHPSDSFTQCLYCSLGKVAPRNSFQSSCSVRLTTRPDSSLPLRSCYSLIEFSSSIIQ